MKKILFGIIVGFVILGIGFVIGYTYTSKHYKTKLLEVRTAWYQAAMDEEERCAETYAKYYYSDTTNLTYASFMAVGELVGTSYTIESMNKVLIALGENPLFLCDLSIISTRIENIAKRMIEEGKITNYESDYESDIKKL